MAPPPSAPPGALSRALSRAFTTLLGLVLAISGFVMLLVTLVIGLAAAGGWILWSLLRGRPIPPVHVRWPAGARGRPGTGPPPPPAAEVVDVEVRELPDPPADDGRSGR